MNNVKKVHITLVGGQIIPLYQGIIKYGGDEVVLLHSKDTIHQAGILQSHIKVPARLILIKDAFDFESIYNTVGGLVERDCDYFVNITGGTKIMSIALLEAFIKYPNATIFYIDQNQNILDIRSRKSQFAPIHIDIGTIFSLSGNKLVDYKDFKSLDIQILKDAGMVRQMMQYAKGEWYKLMAGLRVDNKMSGLTTPAGSYYTIDKSDQSLTIQLFKAGKSMKYTWKGKDGLKLVKDTQWFEIEVAEILSRWRYCRELYMHSKVAYQAGTEKNEIDIIVNTEGKLIFVECKTQVFDIKDIDKFRNVVKNYGGLAAKAVLITDQPVNQLVAEKCRDNSISYFSLKGSPDDPPFLSTSDMLYNFLESILKSNNPV